MRAKGQMIRHRSGGPGGHQFLEGKSEGRAVLDAARPAREFPGLKLPTDLAIVGYSQGGHATLWARMCRAGQVVERRMLPTGGHVAVAMSSTRKSGAICRIPAEICSDLPL